MVYSFSFGISLRCCQLIVLFLLSTSSYNYMRVDGQAAIASARLDGESTVPPAWVIELERQEEEERRQREAARIETVQENATLFAIAEINRIGDALKHSNNNDGPTTTYRYKIDHIHHINATTQYGDIRYIRNVTRTLRMPDGAGRFRFYRVVVPEEQIETTIIDTAITLRMTISGTDHNNDNTNNIDIDTKSDPISLEVVVSIDAQNTSALTVLRNWYPTADDHAGHISSTTIDTDRFNVNLIDQLRYTSRVAQKRADERLIHMDDKSAQQQPYEDGSNTNILSVLCVNIWNLNYWSERQQILATEILRLSPDIIGFQEVRSRKLSTNNSSRYQIIDLIQMLNYQYEYVSYPAMGFWEGGTREYVQEGLAIFSRYPIISVDPVLLSRNPMDIEDFHQRMLLRATVLTKQGPINILTTHLSLSSRARERTTREIGEYINRLDYPSILMGDFNAEWDTSVNQLVNIYELNDAWVDVHGIDAMNTSSSWTFQSWSPMKRIDYILLTSHLTAISATVEGRTGISMPGLPPIAGVADMHDTMFPSDHMFLLVTVKAGNNSRVKQMKEPRPVHAGIAATSAIPADNTPHQHEEL